MAFGKKSYMRRALTEEAQGNYSQAAALYARVQEFEKVGEMYETMGDLLRLLSKKIKAYQQALRWYKVPEHRESAAGKLARAMESDIRAGGGLGKRQRLLEAAEYYALARQWKQAGEIYEQLRMPERATEMYVQGGAIDEIERLASQNADRTHQKVTAQQSYQEACAYQRVGQRDKAYHTLQQCLSLDPNHAEAEQLLGTLESLLHPTEVRHVRLPADEREYLLFAKPVVTIGRQEDNDIVVMNTDVSRHHARFGIQNQSCLLEDLGSSNGSRLNGLRINQAATVHAHDRIGIGRNFQLEVDLQQRPSGISAMLDPLAVSGGARYCYIIFSGEIFIGSDSGCELSLISGLVTTPLPYLFKIGYRAPYWYLNIHPHASKIEFNGVVVQEYVVIAAGDILTVEGFQMMFH